MNPAQRRLLQRVADRESFNNRDVHSAEEGARCDAEVEALQELEGHGWITLALKENHMTKDGTWYAVAPTITDEGRDELAKP